MNTTSHYATVRDYFPHFPALHELIQEQAVRANIDDNGAQYEALYTNGKDILFPVSLLAIVAAALGIGERSEVTA